VQELTNEAEKSMDTHILSSGEHVKHASKFWSTSVQLGLRHGPGADRGDFEYRGKEGWERRVIHPPQESGHRKQDLFSPEAQNTTSQ